MRDAARSFRVFTSPRRATEGDARESATVRNATMLQSERALQFRADRLRGDIDVVQLWPRGDFRRSSLSTLA